VRHGPNERRGHSTHHIGFRSNATVSANSSAGSSSNKARDNSPETDARIRVEVWSSPTARDLSWTEMIFFVQENIEGYPWAEKMWGTFPT